MHVKATNLDVQFSYGTSEDTLQPIGKNLSMIVIADGQGNAQFNGPGVGIYATSKGKESINKASFDWFYYNPEE